MSEKNYSIGKLIRSIRTGIHLSQCVVCKGLCSLNAFIKIEKGEIEPNPYMVFLIFERMGVSINKYGLVYSQREYQELKHRCEIISCLKSGKSAELESRLAEYLVLTKPTNYHKQFLAYVRLIGLGGVKSQDRIAQAEAALKLTVPDYETRSLEFGHYTGIERALLLFIAQAYYKAGRHSESICLVEKLLKNMDRFIVDREELGRQYPLIVCGVINNACGKQTIDLAFCEKALSLVLELQHIKCLRTLLEYYVRYTYKELDKDMKEMLLALSYYEDQYGYSFRSEEELFACLIEEPTQGILLEKLLQSLRRNKGITGAELCDEVCEPEHYSRIERGMSLPSQTSYQKLMKKLGRSGYRYYPNIVSNNYRVHILYREISRDISRFQYENASEKWRLLKKKLDMSIPLNQQSVEFQGITIDASLHPKEEISVVLKRLEQCLNITVPADVDIRDWPLTQIEIKLLNGIAVVKKDRGNVDAAIQLLDSVRISCEQNERYLRNDGDAYFMILYNLIRYLGRRDIHEEAERMAHEYARLACEMDMGYEFFSFLYFECWNHELLMQRKKNTQEEQKKYAEQRYYRLRLATKAAGFQQLSELAKRHYEKYADL